MVVIIEGTEFTMEELFAGVSGQKVFGVQMNKRNELGIYFGIQFTHYTHSKSSCGHYYYRLREYNGRLGSWHRIHKKDVAMMLEQYSLNGFSLGY